MARSFDRERNRHGRWTCATDCAGVPETRLPRRDHRLSNLTRDQAVELGSVIGGLIGLGEDGEQGLQAGAVAGAERAGQGDFTPLGGPEDWDILEDIPNGSAAALILLEHQWAVPLRDAIARAGGYRISDGFISPLDLIEAGLHSAEEAAELHALENRGAAVTV
jgi:hypothetical protein